ncbi:16578_t:CDS:2, partial [Racocetra fulgida]
MNNTTDNAEYAEHSDNMVLVQDISSDISAISNMDSLSPGEISFQSSISLPKGDSKKVQRKKKLERLGGSVVKPFYKIIETNGVEFWACCHKSCQNIKYQNDGFTSNHWQHLRSRHHISKAIVESGYVNIVPKDSKTCEFQILAESSQITIIQKHEYKELGSYKLDNESDTESLQDPTVSVNKNSNEDIFYC